MFLFAIYFIVIPVLIYGSLFIKRSKPAYSIVRDIGLGLTSLVILTFILRWDLASTYVRPLVIPLYVAIAVFAYRHHWRRIFEEVLALSWQRKLKACFMAVVIPLTAFFVLVARLSDDAGALVLQWPLEPGVYFVAQGGSSELFNHHYSVVAQRYAVDLTELDKTGRHATSIMPSSLKKYHINEKQIVSPCAGQIVALDRTWEPRDVRSSNRTAPAGNYVALHCDGHTVVLAHFSRLEDIAIGEVLGIGEPLGLVGSTGNSTEPHLHIHAVLGNVSEYDDLMYNSVGVPMLFNGRFLKRNDIFELPNAEG